MDGDMSWIWWLLIAFVVMSMFKGGGHHKRHREMQEQIDELRRPSPSPPPAPQLPGASRAEVERLEQRVRVLERIVTDGGYDLAAQIEALRDRRSGEARLEAADNDRSS